MISFSAKLLFKFGIIPLKEFFILLGKRVFVDEDKFFSFIKNYNTENDGFFLINGIFICVKIFNFIQIVVYKIHFFI